MSSASCPAGVSPRAVGFLRLFVIGALFLSLLGTVLAAGSAGAGVPDGTPVADPPVEASAEPSADLVEIPDEEPGDVTMRTMACPDGYELTLLDPVALAADCAAPIDGITVTLSDGVTPLTSSSGDSMPGAVMFGAVAPGDYSLAVAPPADAETIVGVACERTPDGSPLVKTISAPIAIEVLPGEAFACDVYVVPAGTGSAAVLGEIRAEVFTCPAGYDVLSDLTQFLADCTIGPDGVTFVLTSGDGSINLQSDTGDSVPYTVTFGGLEPGDYELTEVMPDGIAAAAYACSVEDAVVQDGDGNAPTLTAAISLSDDAGFDCQFFNIPAAESPSASASASASPSASASASMSASPSASPSTGGLTDLVIRAWNCPLGFDLASAGDSALDECTTSLDGVRFVATGPNYGPIQTDTGDSIPGAVMFGGLLPGTYTVMETMPDGTAYAFLGGCTGWADPGVHPFPLAVGAMADIPVAGGQVTCDWFNVPQPVDGAMTVTKFACDGPTPVGADCEVYEGGVTFRVLLWTGTWTQVDEITTGADGRATALHLEPGRYVLAEVGGDPCGMEASLVDELGYVAVTATQTTSVFIYNCEVPEVPGRPASHQPNTTPVTFPDTGVAPADALADDRPNRPARSPRPSSQLIGEMSPAPACPSISAADASVSPAPSAPGVTVDLEPVTGAETSALASASPACERGERPAAIAIPDADVDAGVETVETVAGAMQAPTGPDDAAWYVETSRLGEEGLTIMSGHLNYVGQPEAVFGGLAGLEAGDTVEVTGTDGGVYRYEVQEVEQVAADANAGTVFDGIADEYDGEALVLITCGGDWDPSASAYDERTVVVATRVDAA